MTTPIVRDPQQPLSLDALSLLTLKSGSHGDRGDGLCVMERHLVERLLPYLRIDCECVVFAGTRNNQGYGTLRVDGRMQKVHRLVYALLRGPIPNDLCVLHRCDNPPCCRIEHLFLGTVGDNNRDRADKGRSRGTFGSDVHHPAKMRRGERHWQAKLSDADTARIRERRATGETTVAIASAYSINPATVSRIARGIWRTA